MNKKIIAVFALLALMMVGCTSIAPQPEQVALEYNGGPFDSKNFAMCKNSAERDWGGANSSVFYYPTGARTFSFNGDGKDSDSPALVMSASGIDLTVNGTVDIVLDINCQEFTDSNGKVWKGGTAQVFHEKVGRRLGAYSEDPEVLLTDGWRAMLREYVGRSVDETLDNAGVGFTWQDLYLDQAKKAKWEAEVKERLPKLVESRLGVPFFRVVNVSISKPELPAAIKDQIIAKEAAKEREQVAGVDAEAAQNFPGGIQGYLAYQRELAVNKAITEGKVQIIPVPQGSPVIVSPQK